MPWNLALKVTNADDGSPMSDIPILEGTQEGRKIAETDTSGEATMAFDPVTFDAGTRALNALYIATTRFSLQHSGQNTIVTLYDREIYTRVVAGLPPHTGERPAWNVQYTITDDNGNPVTGIPAINPLTGAVLASNPTVTLSAPSQDDDGVHLLPEINPTISAGSVIAAGIGIDLKIVG